MNINTQNTNIETILLKDLVQQKRIEMKRGKVISKTTGQYPVYSSSVQNNGLMCYSDDYMFDEELISWSIDGGGDFFYRPKHRYSLTNVSGYIRVLDKNINCKYLYCILDLLHSKEHFDYTTKAHPSVICKMYKVPLPNIEVQKKIATILFTMEDLINEEQSTITKLKETKRSLLGLLFPSNNSNYPQLRFKNFTSPWEQCKLCKMFIGLQNNTLSRANLSENIGVAKNIHYGDILIKFGEILEVNKVQLPFIVDRNVLSKYKTSYLQNGDIIIADTAEDATVGKCSEIVGLNNEVVLSGLHTMPYRPLKKFASQYLGYYFNSATYHNQLVPLMQGIKVTSISKSAIQDTKIVYPQSIDEQSKIGLLFKHIDDIITLHQCKLKKYKEIKSALLNKLLV